MNIKTLKSLKEGDMVLCTKSYRGVMEQKNVLTKGTIYEIGGEFWKNTKIRIKNLDLTDHIEPSDNYVCIKENDVGKDDGWQHIHFIKITNKNTAKVLFGDDDEI